MAKAPAAMETLPPPPAETLPEPTPTTPPLPPRATYASARATSAECVAPPAMIHGTGSRATVFSSERVVRRVPAYYGLRGAGRVDDVEPEHVTLDRDAEVADGAA